MLRRRCLFLMLGFVAYLLTLGKKGAWGMFFARPKRVEQPKIPTNPFTRAGKTLVGVAEGNDVEKGVRDAVELIGGFGRLDLHGKTVLVKPNVVSGKPHPTTTSPEIVRAMVKLLYEAGARKVYVGDMSALITLAASSTLRQMEKTGIKQAAEEAGAEVIGFEDHGWVEVPLPGARHIDRLRVTEWLFKVDRVVNLPVIKTHRSASYSICLKNFVGCTHLRQRPYLIDADHWEELVAEFNLAFRPDLHLVDGTVSMIEGGPWEGTSAQTHLIIASGDPVAADVVGLGIIKAHDRWEMVTSKGVWEQRQIRHALEVGLGSGREDIRLLTTGGGAEFEQLLVKVRELAGL